MTAAAAPLDQYTFTDFTQLTFTPQFVAERLMISTQTLKAIEKEHDLNIARVARGSVEVRSYTLADMFLIASIRRANGNTKGFSSPITCSTYVQKGGTAKTTTTCNIGIEFALAGFKTLIIDNDPQADVSSMLGYDPDQTTEELVELGLPADRAVEGHLGNLIRLGNFPEMTLDQVIKKPFGEHGPHLIPAYDSLDDMDVVLRNAQGADFRYSLFIERARKGLLPHCDLSSYDVIIMDNAPSGTMLSRNSLAAADFLLCPIRMDKFSFRALSRLAHKINEMSSDFGRAPEIIAIPTMYMRNRPRLQANLARLSSLFPGKVTEQPLFHSEDYSKSLEDGVPLALWKQGNENSLGAFRHVFEEMVGRIKTVLEKGK
jgi:cellulose biosynthesis protein BcsQ